MEMNRDIDIAVIGAGAAGLMAAISAGRRLRGTGARIVVLERASRIGAKIRISGGGRCNITNERVEAEDFNGSKRNQIAKVLRTFNADQTIEFFEQLGVRLKVEERGKLFPVTDRAQTVIDALVGAATDAGVTLVTGVKVEAVERRDDTFVIRCEGSEWTAKTVILATGGRSVPKTGSDGFGYVLVQHLGHSVTATWPALVPLLTPPGHPLQQLSGIASDVTLVLQEVSGRVRTTVGGAMLFTHFGVSGPAVLDVSRHWIEATTRGDDARLLVRFGDRDASALDRELTVRQRTGAATVGGSVASNLPSRLSEHLLRTEAGVDPSTPLHQLTREQRQKIVSAFTRLELPVHGDRGFDYAEVTAGGVPLDELQLATMESRVCPRLFLCGEILDVDGRIGGFNFQWAWSSGWLAGGSAAAAVSTTESASSV